MYDAIVIGGGFYGCSVAAHLSKKPGFKKVLLIEREKELMSRASLNNQGRLHNGYHYPRSLATARRSRANLPRFLEQYYRSLVMSPVMVYAIAKRGSKTSPKQYERFCEKIRIPLKKVDGFHLNPKFIAQAYLTSEFFFNANVLRVMVNERLFRAAAQLDLLRDSVVGIERWPSDNAIGVRTLSGNGDDAARYVFNCTFAGLNQIAGVPRSRTELKHELFEMVLLECPKELQGVGITVMDGPFFSLVPSMTHPGLHNLAHVRLSIHKHWLDRPGTNPYRVQREFLKKTRVKEMVEDAARFVPAIAQSKYVDSIFEIKTVPANREKDDGRPVVCERYRSMPGYFTILGSKIDHVYDALDQVDRWVD